MSSNRFITLDPRLCTLFQQNASCKDIQTAFFHGGLQSWTKYLCIAVHFQHMELVAEMIRTETYLPHSQYKPLITAVHRKSLPMIKMLCNNSKYSFPDELGFGIIEGNKLYTDRQTTALDLILEQDNVAALQHVMPKCHGEPAALQCIAEQNNASECLKVIKNLERHRNMKRSRMTRMFHWLQRFDGRVTELQQRSILHLWMSLRQNSESKFLSDTDQKRLRKLLDDPAKQTKFFREQARQPILKKLRTAPLQDASEDSIDCLRLYGKLMLECCHLLLTTHNKIPRTSLSMLLQNVRSILYIGHQISHHKLEFLEGGMVLNNLLVYRLMQHGLKQARKSQTAASLVEKILGLPHLRHISLLKQKHTLVFTMLVAGIEMEPTNLCNHLLWVQSLLPSCRIEKCVLLMTHKCYQIYRRRMQEATERLKKERKMLESSSNGVSRQEHQELQSLVHNGYINDSPWSLQELCRQTVRSHMMPGNILSAVKELGLPSSLQSYITMDVQKL